MANREIKFRRVHFKDKEKTQFSHVDEWGVNVRVGNHIANFVNPSSNNVAIYFTDCQFTGLKDKNGKEIYEGDVLRYRYARDMSGKDIVEFEETVEWENTTDFVGFGVHQTMEHEVIGNIYQNPDLVEDSDPYFNFPSYPPD